MSLMKIGIYVAMQSEAKSFIESMKFKETINTDPYGFKAYKLQNDHYEIHLYVGEKDQHHEVQSVGTLPAGIATEMMIRNFSPNLVINAGTAGGFRSRGAEIGDVYLAHSTQFHDRRIQIPGYPEYGRYYLKHEHEFINRLNEKLKLKTGLLTTSDSLDYIQEDQKIVEAHKAVLKDMEGASIAWVCHHHKVPVIFIKAVTDIVDGPHPTEDEFFSNLHEASQNLSKTLIRIIQEQYL